MEPMTDNTEHAGAEAGAGENASPSFDPASMMDSNRDTFPTMLIHDAMQSNKAVGDDSGDEGGKEKEAEAKDNGQEKGIAPSFDFKATPEYREMSEQMSQMKGMIEAFQGVLSKAGGGTAREAAETPDFKDVMSMSEDEFREMQDTDPRALFANMGRQLVHEIKESLKGEFDAKSHTEKRSSALRDFMGKNSEFVDLYRSGAIQGLINENPIHNHISAFYELTLPKIIEKATKELSAKHKAELNEAVKKAKEEAKNSFAVRAGARVLGTGPAAHATRTKEDASADLKNSKTFGGMARALLRRHEARESARSGQ